MSLPVILVLPTQMVQVGPLKRETHEYGFANNDDELVDNSPPFSTPPQPHLKLQKQMAVPIGLEGHAHVSPRLPIGGSASTSMTSMSLVNSILSDTVKYPTPPLIGPQIEALSRCSDQSQPNTVTSSSSPEINLDDGISLDMKNPGLRLISDFDKCNESCAAPEIPVASPAPTPIEDCPRELKSHPLDD